MRTIGSPWHKFKPEFSQAGKQLDANKILSSKHVSRETEQPSYNFETCLTRLNATIPPYRYFPRDVLASIEFSGGNLREMSILLGRTYTSVRDYVFNHLETANALREQEDIRLDQIEKALFHVALVAPRDPATIRYLCQTLARSRGYVHEVRHRVSSAPLEFELVLANGETW